MMGFLINSENNTKKEQTNTKLSGVEIDLRKLKLDDLNAIYEDGVLVSIEIPEGVVEIPSNIFSELKYLRRIKLPNSLRFIQYDAFAGCVSLEELDIPPLVEKISGETISSCWNLKKLVFRNTLSYLPYLGSLKNLEELMIPNGIDVINKGDFCGVYDNLKSLKKIKLSSGLKQIGDGTFSKFKNLEEIEFPEGLEIIGRGAFEFCESLKEVKFPDTLQEIRCGAFSNCNSLEKIIIPSSVKLLDYSAFFECKMLREVIFEDGLTEDGLTKIFGGFSRCKLLKYVKLPSTLKKLGGVFCECEALEEIEIPEGVEYLSGTFSSCKNLKYINLPKSLKRLSDSAFSNCTSLTEIDIPEGTEEIGDSIFFNCSNLKYVKLPSSLTYMGIQPFRGTNLEKLELWASITDKNNIHENSLELDKRLKELIINYVDYNSLINFLKIIRKGKCSLVKNVERVTFVGCELKKEEKKKIERLFSKGISFIYQDNEINNNYNKMYLDSNILDEEINEYLDKLNIIMNGYSSDFRKIIEDKIKKIFDKYKIDLERENRDNSPVLSISNSEIVQLVNRVPIGYAKNNLISELLSLTLKLSSHIEYMKLSGEIDIYLMMIDSVVDTMPDNQNSIDKIIQSIVYLTSFMDDERKKKYLGDTRNVILEYKKVNQKSINEIVNDDILLRIDSSDISLINNLNKIYINVSKYYNKVEKYLLLLNCLKRDIKSEKLEDESINSFINSTRYIISNLNFNSSLNLEFKDICDKYIKIINEMIKIDDVSDDKYILLEQELRRELDKFYIKLHEWALKENKVEKIALAIENAKKIIDEEGILCKECNSVIESLVIDILERLQNKMIQENKYLSVKTQVIEILDEGINKINDIAMVDKVEDISLLISSKLSRILIGLDLYIRDMKKFDERKKILTPKKSDKC